MDFVENITVNDIIIYLSFLDSFKDPTKFKVGASFQEPLKFMVWRENEKFTLEITCENEILINGELSKKFSSYWQLFLLRFYEDGYQEFFYNKIKKLIKSNLDWPLDVDEVFNLLQPTLKQIMIKSLEKASKIWPEVLTKNNSFSKKRGK